MLELRRSTIAGLLALAVVGVPLAGGAQQAPRRVNKFLSYDARARTARLAIVASSDTSNNALNYNGKSDGRLEIEVPLGWTVQVHLVNAGDLQHSALVIEKNGEPPIVPASPVFRGSSIEPADVGLIKAAHDSMTFVASKPGTFAMVCGVPAHAQLGMWVRFTVSAQSLVPRYRPIRAQAAASGSAGHGK